MARCSLEQFVKGPSGESRCYVMEADLPRVPVAGDWVTWDAEYSPSEVKSVVLAPHSLARVRLAERMVRTQEVWSELDGRPGWKRAQ